jgi:hypothetical protein
MATVACFFMARALRRAGAREAALEADLVRQKEALQQAERKSMNKSNAFARAPATTSAPRSPSSPDRRRRLLCLG